MKQFVGFIKHLISAIIKHNIGALGARISFFSFSAMVPLLLLLIYGASIFIPHASIQRFLSDVVRSYVPTIPESGSYLIHMVSRLVLSDPNVGLFGVFGLLWSTIGGFVSFQQVLDVIWETRHRRAFWKQYLIGFGMLGLLLLLTVLSSLATALSPLLLRGLVSKTHLLPWVTLVHGISLVSFPFLLFLTCYVCYRFLPSYPLKNLHLLIGAATSTVVVYVSRALFMVYVGHLGHYRAIYGGLTFIMLFIFWLYIVSMIVLFGAEVAMALHATHGMQGPREITAAPSHARFMRRRSRI